MFQYILFDLDGTLTNPKIGITSSVQYALKSFGIEENNLDTLEPFIGPPLLDSFMEYYDFSVEQAKQAIEKYRERFETIGLYENEIYPGIKEMLEKLSDKNVHLAVASSKPTVFVEKILVHFNIRQYFEVVVGSELDGRRTDKKEVVDEALKQLGVTEKNRQSSAMVGDRKFDIEGAKAHGVRSVGVSYGFAEPGELEKCEPDFLAGSIAELSDYLLDKEENKKPEKLPPPPERTSFLRAFSIISPILIYYIVNNLMIFGMAYLVRWLSNGDSAKQSISLFLSNHSLMVSSVIKFLAMAIGVLSVYSAFRMERPIFITKRAGKKEFIMAAVLGGVLALFINVLFSLIGFTGSSAEYHHVAETQFALPLLGGILLYGIFSPLAEEIIFRGIVYNRLRRQYPFVIAFLSSGILFGVFHGNVVQAVYGFLLGLLITWMYEQYESFWIPVIVHAAANICVYIVVGLQPVKAIVMTPAGCIILGIWGSMMLWFILKNDKTNILKKRK